jgi:ABC-type lipoprotein release transport system permease subunit
MLLLAAVTLVATLIPLRRALTIAPVDALRAD